jgi:hypothetical protein
VNEKQIVRRSENERLSSVNQPNAQVFRIGDAFASAPTVTQLGPMDDATRLQHSIEKRYPRGRAGAKEKTVTSASSGRTQDIVPTRACLAVCSRPGPFPRAARHARPIYETAASTDSHFVRSTKAWDRILPFVGWETSASLGIFNSTCKRGFPPKPAMRKTYCSSWKSS